MKQYKFGVNLTTFNRFEYLKKTLDSLSKTIFLPNTVLLITDDCSTDINVINLLNDFIINNENVKLIKYFNKSNLGSKNNYIKSILYFEQFDIEFLVNLDSDCILNNKWLIELNKLINTFDENIICSSFCCKFHHGNPHNYIRLIEENYYERDTLNGLGVCFSKKLINDFNIETNKHFDEFLCKELKNKYKMRCICTSTSYIQHIGLYGVHSNPSTCDISDNFLGE